MHLGGQICRRPETGRLNHLCSASWCNVGLDLNIIRQLLLRPLVSVYLMKFKAFDSKVPLLYLLQSCVFKAIHKGGQDICSNPWQFLKPNLLPFTTKYIEVLPSICVG